MGTSPERKCVIKQGTVCMVLQLKNLSVASSYISVKWFISLVVADMSGMKHLLKWWSEFMQRALKQKI